MINIPDAIVPAGNYLAYTQMDNILYVSGQTCRKDNKMEYQGRLGDDASTEYGYEAAKLCALNVLSQVKHFCNGDLSRIEGCLKLNIYIKSTQDFMDQAAVANGASDLMVECFGEAGKHVRAAVSVYGLPGGSTIEIESAFKLKSK